MPARRGVLTLLHSAARAVVAPPRRFHLASSSSSLAAGRAGNDVVANATAASPPMPTPMDDVRREKHARVSIPRALPPLSARPFAETISPCAPGDAAAVLRQSKKRRGYPIACAARCRHGRYRAFLHAPMHVPAATADGSIDGVGVGGDGDGEGGRDTGRDRYRGRARGRPREGPARDGDGAHRRLGDALTCARSRRLGVFFSVRFV